jgi:hypothetical protein
VTAKKLQSPPSTRDTAMAGRQNAGARIGAQNLDDSDLLAALWRQTLGKPQAERQG